MKITRVCALVLFYEKKINFLLTINIGSGIINKAQQKELKIESLKTIYDELSVRIKTNNNSLKQKRMSKRKKREQK